ncbi:hypothetical protein RIF29_05281 [Crotalaria pallida]|uniref:Uncharacterized protein n=1 Tax=Crotalaria pallida TaxID=3830 RepID=A0AAN9J1U9_CROPI
MHAKPSSPNSKDNGAPFSIRGAIQVRDSALANFGEGVISNPNGQEQRESIPIISGTEGKDVVKIEEPTHGDWLVVTRKKRIKQKSQRPVKHNDKERENNAPSNTRAQDASDKVDHVQDAGAHKFDVAVKRGPGKRSRLEGKHSTPTHVLLRNAGVKGLDKAHTHTISNMANYVTFQAGNFGVSTPRLFKDTQMQEGPGKEGVVLNHDVDMVPETQLVFDPGQTKFNPEAFMQG